MYTFSGFTTGPISEKQVTILLIGNDIVDLHAQELVHPRFARRVMSDAEYRRYNDSGQTEQFLWRAWAAKEAAYKLEKQRNTSIFFSPSAFVFDDQRSTVAFDGRTLVVTFANTSDYVFCVCSEGAGRIENFMKPVSEDQHSVAVRELACHKIADILRLNPSDLSIVATDDRVPQVMGPAGLLPCVVSLSHHGRWVAVSVGL